MNLLPYLLRPARGGALGVVVIFAIGLTISVKPDCSAFRWRLS